MHEDDGMSLTRIPSGEFGFNPNGMVGAVKRSRPFALKYERSGTRLLLDEQLRYMVRHFFLWLSVLRLAFGLNTINPIISTTNLDLFMEWLFVLSH